MYIIPWDMRLFLLHSTHLTRDGVDDDALADLEHCEGEIFVSYLSFLMDATSFETINNITKAV